MSVWCFGFSSFPVDVRPEAISLLKETSAFLLAGDCHVKTDTHFFLVVATTCGSSTECISLLMMVKKNIYIYNSIFENSKLFFSISSKKEIHIVRSSTLTVLLLGFFTFHFKWTKGNCVAVRKKSRKKHIYINSFLSF